MLIPRIDEAKNWNQTTDFVGPVFLGTSGYNEQYNSRLAGRPMPGIGAERLAPVEFSPDFDSLQQHVSAKSNAEELIAQGFTREEFINGVTWGPWGLRRCTSHGCHTPIVWTESSSNPGGAPLRGIPG